MDNCAVCVCVCVCVCVMSKGSMNDCSIQPFAFLQVYINCCY